MITYERQEDGTLKQVDSPPKRAELVEQRIYDRCIVRVGQLEAEKATLEARIDELCAENEKLRKKADMLQWNSDCFIKIYGAWKRLRATVPHLEAENAKLRELVSTIYMCSNIRCDQCKYRHGNTCAFDAEAELLELGIEVAK